MVMLEPTVLRNYGKLYIGKSELIRQTKLFWINLRHYIQTCSNDHLCKVTTRLRRPRLSSSKQIPVQSLLCKMTTCLTRPATTFLSPKWKKSLSKTTTKNFIQQRTPEQTSGSMILFTLLLLYNAKFVQCLQKLDNL